MTKSSSLVGTGESRRSFLKKAATVAAVASVPALLKTPVYGQNQAPSANVLGANDRITLGYIGMGKQGMYHLRIIKPHLGEVEHPRGRRQCDVYQKHLDNALKSADLTAADGYRDHRRLMERKDIDAIVITAVDNWHGPCTLEGLDAGKHVYCEKPMTRYAAEGWDVYDKVKSTGKVYQCGSQYTADPVFHKVGDWVKDRQTRPARLGAKFLLPQQQEQ
jgi:predicted dehydrogenase